MVDRRFTRPASELPAAALACSACTLATAAAAVAPKSPAVLLRRFTAGETLVGLGLVSSSVEATEGVNLTGRFPAMVCDLLCTAPVPSFAFCSNIFNLSRTDIVARPGSNLAETELKNTANKPTRSTGTTHDYINTSCPKKQALSDIRQHVFVSTC